MFKDQLQIGPSQQIGPLQVWPLIWEDLIAHNYKVPPVLDSLLFSEIEDEDGPTVDWIQVHNPTDDPFIIPSGWIFSANLWQDRTLNSMEYIEPHSTVGLSVSCVEKSRWSAASNEIDGGRAPFSVIAAGWEFDSSKGYWCIDKTSRQTRVWNQVSRQESRSGTRPTNSLRQVMNEDSRESHIQRTVLTEFNQKIITLPEQNGVLIALDGQPLVGEFFSNPISLKKTLKDTFRAVSFDASTTVSLGISSEEVRRFLMDIEHQQKYEIDTDHWGALLAGGSSGIDTRISVNEKEEILHLTTINRNHRVLLGV